MMLNPVAAADTDGDGVDDSQDDCSPDGEYEWVSDNSTDFDGDGCKDATEDDDDDNDGVLDGNDNCPQTDLGDSVDSDGCADNQLDSDEDGYSDDIDNCPGHPNPWQENYDADNEGDICDTDDDNDGVTDTNDDCQTGVLGWTSTSETDHDSDGCQDATEDDDDDNDGVLDGNDFCPQTGFGDSVNSVGCAANQLDTDSDGVLNEDDLCPQTGLGDSVNTDGCAIYQLDTDGDGVNDSVDYCTNIYGNSTIDVVGCIDSDGDGWSDMNDYCPSQYGTSDYGCPLPSWGVNGLTAYSGHGGSIELEWGYSGGMLESDDYVIIWVTNAGNGALVWEGDVPINYTFHVISGDYTYHNQIYEITLYSCTIFSCSEIVATVSVIADKEVDPYAYSTNLVATTWNEDSWMIEWETFGLYTDVAAWYICWSDIEWFDTVSAPSDCLLAMNQNGGIYDFSSFTQPTYWFVIVPVDSYGNSPSILPQLQIDIDDPDGDGFRGDEDDCPLEPGDSFNTWSGCPDSDGDGWADLGDACPDFYGEYDGCEDGIMDPTNEADGFVEESMATSSTNLIFFGGIGISVIFIVLAITVVVKRGKKKSELARSSGAESRRLGSIPPMQYGAPVPRQRASPPQPSQAPFPPQPVSRPPPSTAAPLSLQQRFAVAEMLAEGGMAEVYKATERSTGEVVVWKQAHGKHNPLSVSNMKLEEEAELMQIIPHPRIPQYITHGKITDKSGKGKVVMVQEFIEGGDLKNTVDQIMKVGASISIEKIIEYLSAICEPLENMANLPEPIYHRDLKPHNVIIHPQRGPILIDFGLAKMVATGEDMSVTRGGSGTWTPPERDSGISGPFTDVWSLGKIMFYLCTNQKPAAILAEVDMQTVYDNGHPEWVGQLILKAVNPRYQDRVESVTWFKYLLNARGDWENMSSTQTTSSDDFTTWG